ncbi:MAG TPA: DUF721 domain-containing protein [Actinomycetota bacterium]
MERPRRGDPPSEPTGVGEILRGLLSEGPLRRGLRLGRLGRVWPQVVGERLAPVTAPVSLDEGGLVVSASTQAWAAQVRFLADEIGRRAAEVLGEDPPPPVRVVVGPERPKRGA